MAMPNSALHAARRSADLQALKKGEELDILVVGGGITGVGIALDAASRGLRTALVEKHDLAFGTSRFSSKLIHGGLRYLAKLEFGIAYNSAVERGRLLEVIAPHLVKPLAQISALGPDTTLAQKIATRIGYLAGDVLRSFAGTPTSVLPRSRYITPATTCRLFPAVNRAGLLGAWLNYDGQMIDDARLVMAVARTAAEHEARIITRCAATHLTGTSATLTDVLTGDTYTVRAKAVVNATGVWAGTVEPTISIRPSRGTHLVFDAEKFGNPTGSLVFPLKGSFTRFLFIIPEQFGRCYLGLTDEESPGDIPDVPETPDTDIAFLLDGVNQSLGMHLTTDDVRGVFTGLRPLIDAGSGQTADVSRKHAIITSPDGVVSVVGGKYTEYRLMAEETIDAVLEATGISTATCKTKTLPLVGAPGHIESMHIDMTRYNELPESMIARFGYEAPTVLSTATISDPLGKIAGLDVTRAEIEFAFTHEGALNIDDVLDRRTRIGLVPEDRQQALSEIEAIYQYLQRPGDHNESFT